MSDAFRIDRTPDRTAEIVLTRADRHNVFDETLIADLTSALEVLDRDATVDTVVLSAEGPSFSAGGDLGWMQRAAAQGHAANQADAEALAGLMRALDRLRQTTVALVQGSAYGGGVGLVACCDIVVAADAAVFVLSEVKLGLIPAVISPYVIAAIGPRQARRYMQTAEPIDATTALRLGLVHEVVAADRLRARATEIRAALAKGAPGAKAAAKRLIPEIAGRPIDADLVTLTSRRIADIRAGDEAAEGLSAFFDRRKPEWIR